MDQSPVPLKNPPHQDEKEETKKDKASSSKQRLQAWGERYYHACHKPSLEDNQEIDQIACTHQSTLFLQQGKVYQTGTLHGQVFPHPTRITIPLPLKCEQIAAGRHFCLAKMEGGQAVVSWGAGHFGQLGLGGDDMITFTPQPLLMERLLPRQVGSPIRQVACGGWHGMVLTESGKVWAWGSNRNWQCGRPLSQKSQNEAPTFTVPLPVPQLDNIIEIAGGRSHSVALTHEHEVYCWGASQHGQCATSLRRSVSGVAPPKKVDSLSSKQTSIVQVAAGGNHTMCLTAGGRVFVWGAATEGQLGLGAEALPSQSKPRLVQDLDFVAVAAGSRTAAAASLADVPVIQRIAAGALYSAAISTAGHVYVWGSNDAGQLGVVTTSTTVTATDESDLLPFFDNFVQDNEEPAVPSTSSKILRDLHVRTFDSDHNLLLPQRLKAVEDWHVDSIACGPNHMWCLGHERDESLEAPIIGRTLYEMEEQRLLEIRESLPAAAASLGDIIPTRNNDSMRHVPLQEDLTETETNDDDGGGLASSKAAWLATASIPEAVLEHTILERTNTGGTSSLLDESSQAFENNVDDSQHSHNDNTDNNSSINNGSNNRWSIRNMMRRVSSSRSAGSSGNGNRRSNGGRLGFLRKQSSV